MFLKTYTQSFNVGVYVVDLNISSTYACSNTGQMIVHLCDDWRTASPFDWQQFNNKKSLTRKLFEVSSSVSWWILQMYSKDERKKGAWDLQINKTSWLLH